MKPQDILTKMGEQYSECSSYSDSGFVDFDGIHQEKMQIAFRTEFVRPDYLCFEWQDYGPRRGKSEQFSTLWAYGDKVLTRSEQGKVTVEEEPSLGYAIAGATGCSAGAAHKVTALLIDELRTDCKHLLMLTDLELVEQAREGDEQCYVLHGTMFKHSDHTLWISTSDFSLRRLRVDHSRTAEETAAELKVVTENAELMARLKEKGIAPPTGLTPKAVHFVTEYFYSQVSFDRSINRAPQPVC